MKYLSNEEMVNCYANGEGFQCALAILGRVGAMTGLAAAGAATGGVGLLFIGGAFVSYCTSGIMVAVECAEWLSSITE